MNPRRRRLFKNKLKQSAAETEKAMPVVEKKAPAKKTAPAKAPPTKKKTAAKSKGFGSKKKE